ncbi:hypothetical protein GW17_00022128 [Ensete ventricosum]|nr:hypothetical protein GW17_00022128 [Ensete ventricosum]
MSPAIQFEWGPLSATALIVKVTSLISWGPLISWARSCGAFNRRRLSLTVTSLIEWGPLSSWPRDLVLTCYRAHLGLPFVQDALNLDMFFPVPPPCLYSRTLFRPPSPNEIGPHFDRPPNWDSHIVVPSLSVITVKRQADGMAPAMAVHTEGAVRQGLGLGKAAPASEVEELRRRNTELEREVRERRAREEEVRAELERTRARLRVAEEAEESLCAQLGELEAEAVAHARACHLRIKELSDQLELARRAVLSRSSLSLSSLSDES